ncbi:competence protein ComK [Anaerobacillus isosaccharinicus]|uniref:Competence protein n=1 Tax=Anaerobacillus isosaccharinicus TaxID=1532552 RepID=A0A1S2MEE2_9BACI|nr:competence protein ComK [Anaerobacillus isosaccharinicus]MBA5586460.1 competence protein ComK [Anaerobacillus isosaccharinicus]QOY35297.1 competence protein ComK [Anaerobacillus isosaccharinicus]
MNTKVLTTYHVSKNTLALLSVAHPDYSTVALEPNGEFYIRDTPLQILKKACLIGGSNYDGRKAAVMYLLGARQKLPIPINPYEHIYAFPTHSPIQFECSWIFYNHVRKISPYHSKQSIITFKNSHQLKLPVSYYTIEKQMQRTAQCIVHFSLLISEKNDNLRTTPELILY